LYFFCFLTWFPSPSTGAEASGKIKLSSVSSCYIHRIQTLSGIEDTRSLKLASMNKVSTGVFD
jgi:hypothetical protein